MNAVPTIAPMNAPVALQRRADFLCDGTASDDWIVGWALQRYKAVQLTEGVFTFGTTLQSPPRRHLFGSGFDTEIVGGPTLAGATISGAGDHIELNDFSIGGGQAHDGTHGIYINVTTSTGFATGAEACTRIHDIETRQVKGTGFVMSGINNRDGQLSRLNAWDSGGSGFLLDCPDMMAEMLVAGTSGSDGIVLGTNSANIHAHDLKSWYSAGDGIVIGSVRHTLTLLEGQDNQKAGIRITGAMLSLTGWTADSNSHTAGNGNANLYAGLEIGLKGDGTQSWANNLQVIGGNAYDKNEGSRGYGQSRPIRLGAGVTGIQIIGAGFGNGTTHHNITDTILWDQPTDNGAKGNRIV